jgi:GDP-L-fucose synthase
LEIVVARAANIFGPYAKFDPARANFIPALIRKAVLKQDPYEIWGSHEVARDVIFSEDFGDAIVALACTCEMGYDTVNVGSGQAVTVGEVVSLILAAAGHEPVNVQWRQDRPTTVGFRALDCTKLASLGWRPKVGLAEGIRRTVSWWQEHKDQWTR